MTETGIYLKQHQKLPHNWEAREKLRDKGQFWTPPWVAEAMIAYLIDDVDLIFDPAVGKGAFYVALKNLKTTFNKKITFYGNEIDENILKEGIKEGIFDSDCKLEINDFIFSPPRRKFKAIVANPPYVRHHRLPLELKNKLKEISLKILGFKLDGRAGLHIYFLIQALDLLEPEGKLAFIMPADTCEGIFSEKLWNWITNKYCLEAVYTFLPEATPFPDVDTNAVVFLIKNKTKFERFYWVNCEQAYSNDLKEFTISRFEKKEFRTLTIINRALDEALRTGLSRYPLSEIKSKNRLIDFATVMRGIATGSNEFFFLTKKQAEKLEISEEFLKPAIGRTRDITGDTITKETLFDLERKGRPTLLFSPDGRELKDFPIKVRDYLLEGEKKGIDKKTLISQRKPWYNMEKRKNPDFLFAYLGRRNARFLKNEAGVVPLTGFLCVYPKSNDPKYVDKLWMILKHPDTLKNLTLVGKSYGGGAIKVEPRALEKLPIPDHLLKEFKLNPTNPTLEYFGLQIQK
jgi:hypothetical protein